MESENAEQEYSQEIQTKNISEIPAGETSTRRRRKRSFLDEIMETEESQIDETTGNENIVEELPETITLGADYLLRQYACSQAQYRSNWMEKVFWEGKRQGLRYWLWIV